MANGWFGTHVSTRTRLVRKRESAAPRDVPPKRRLRRNALTGIGVLALLLGTAQIVFATPPSASLDAPSTLQLNQPGTFTSTTPDPDSDGDAITSIQWQFGDGTTDSGASVTHAYTTPGQKTVRMVVTDAAGEQAEATTTVAVNNTPPTAAFTISDNPANVNQTVTFDGSGSSDPDGPAITDTNFDWDLDGNGSFESSGRIVQRSYATGGDRTITLQVTDANGATATTSRALTVNNRPPVAEFNITPTGNPDAGQELTFDGSGSSDPDGLSIADQDYDWDLDGNGTFEVSGRVVRRSYATGGNRTITLRVTDANGASDTDVETITVKNAPPVARIDYAASATPSGRPPGIPLQAGQNPKVPLIGQYVAFASTSTDAEGPIASFRWIDANEGGPNGEFGTAAGVVHAPYEKAGDKLVVLSVTDEDGGTDEEVATVRVNTRPEADFLFSPQTPVTNECITFNEAASDLDPLNQPDPPDFPNAPQTGQLTKYEWDLDNDGRFGEAAQPGKPCDDGELGEQVRASFASMGPKVLSLRVTDGGGAWDVESKTVQVENTRPTAAFDFAPTFPLPGQEVTFRSTATPSGAGKQIETVEWDFDFDPRRGFEAQASGGSVGHAFGSTGAKTFAIRVTETGGGFDIETGTVTVNAPPQASFRAAPGTPLTGDVMTFSSTASDPDGPLTSQQWDLDNDGQFDDAAGAVASRSFALPGTYTIGLRVSDDRGASAVTTGKVTVALRPLPAPPQIVVLPGVTIQIAGSTTRKGARLSLVRVLAPEGSGVKAKCKGRGCPKKRTKSVEMERTKQRFKKFERRLRAGAKITIAVTKEGFIGRHAKFKIRRGRPPVRLDRCVQPGEKRPSECPPA